MISMTGWNFMFFVSARIFMEVEEGTRILFLFLNLNGNNKLGRY